LAAILIALSAFYSLPNLYPKDPAVQVAANRGGTLDDALLIRVKAALDQQGLGAKSVAIENESLIVRTSNTDDQTQAADTLRDTLGRDYTVALNLASTVPDWLGAFG